MYLTTAEKEKYVSKYRNAMWTIINRFRKRASFAAVPSDDLFQECCVVLLEHAEKSSDHHTLHKLPIRDMINAMCRYVLGQQTVSYPVCRTSDFSKTIHSAQGSVDFFEMEGELSNAPMEDALLHLDFEAFQSTVSEENAQILTLKRQRYRNCEVARTMGMSDVAVTRRLKHMRNAYRVYETED